MIDRNTWTVAAMATIIAAALSLLVGDAHAGIRFERHFGEPARKAGKTVEGNYAEGYAPKRTGAAGGGENAVDPLDYPVSIGEQLNASSGSLVFRVKHTSRRGVRGVWADHPDTLFVLLDERGEPVFKASILWADAVPEWFAGAGIGAIEIRGTVPQTVWGGYVAFDRRIEVGEWATIAFTWGDNVTSVYLDGRLLKDRYTAGQDLHSRTLKYGGDFGRYLEGVRRLRVGADSREHNKPLIAGVVGGFEIHDKALAFAPPKPVIASVTDDTFVLPGISGKLVAGDRITVTLLASPGGKASFDMGKVPEIPMEEVPATSGGPGMPAVDNGTYRGTYTIRPGDDFIDGHVVGHFVSPDNAAADPVESASKWTIETKPQVKFSIDRKDLPADSSSKARIKLVVTDANGNPLKGRHFKLTLATTDQYTGLVGAGDFGKEVGASVETRWRGETDSWGEVEFDYLSGFAAKTAILTAKDLDSSGVAVDFITAFKEASIDIALTQPVSRAALRRGMQYVLKVEASRTELTADGRSRSVIRATLLDPNGVAVPGDPVSFALSSDNGKVNVIKGVTDSSGVATAEYIAGKKIGIVVVTATATLRNTSGSVSIILLADAPAKIYLKARPTTLPADGFSRADLSVKVTDINDNPNKDTKVEFRIAKGGGKLEYPDRKTDGFGDTANRYTSGTVAGIASIVATVRSKVPTEGELARAKNVLFVPYNPDTDDIRVEKWLKKKGESFLRGEALVEYSVGRKREPLVLSAPYDGTMGDQFVEYWDSAEVGQTLATVTPAPR